MLKKITHTLFYVSAILVLLVFLGGVVNSTFIQPYEEYKDRANAQIEMKKKERLAKWRNN